LVMNRRIVRFSLILIAVCCLALVLGLGMILSRRASILSDLNARYETECLSMGWERIIIEVNGVERSIMFRAPDQGWTSGTIIALHGGGGTYTNYCSTVPLGQPMVNFAELALQRGYAVLSLDSGDGLLVDENGNSCGKRWYSFAGEDNSANPDLQFIQAVIDEVIPARRPDTASDNIFLAGISNGGFMVALAGTQLSDRVTAFVPVSAGDPYGTRIDCSTNPAHRVNAPGVFLDRETASGISASGGCSSDTYTNELVWPTPGNLTASCRQFYHEGDLAVDLSCQEKLGFQLVNHGFACEAPFVLALETRRRLADHFWLDEYNQPILDFFDSFR
jgi:pimeloyl-ACP methyl ester carboxylesterase